jgi:acyl dehydratase
MNVLAVITRTVSRWTRLSAISSRIERAPAWASGRRRAGSRTLFGGYRDEEVGMTQTNDAWPNGMPRVGDSARRTRTVTGHDIELFTEMSGDRNPLHYDEEAASATPFAGIVVQGGVTSAILNAVVAEDLPGPGTVFMQVNWSFKAPVRPGDAITGEVRITKVRADKPITELETRVYVEDGTVVLEGNAVCYTMPLPS